MLVSEGNYRVKFLFTIANFFIPPFFIAALASHFLQRAYSSRALLSLVWALSVPFYWTVKVQYDLYVKKADAARRGAVLAPEVKGKWPGNIDVMLRMAKSLNDGYVADPIAPFFDEVGSDTFNLRFLWQDTIISRDHRAIQTVLATGFPDFAKGPILKTRLYGLFANGIFNNDGEEWKAHRALTRPFFARERVTDFDHFARYSDKVIALLRSRALSGQSIDVQDIFGRFTLDAAGEFLFGTTELNTLDLPLPPPGGKARLGPKGTLPDGDYGSFVSAFEEIQGVAPSRFQRSVLWPAFEFFTDTSKKHNRTIDEFIGPLVQRALENKAKREGKKLEVEEGNLIDHLAQSTEDFTTMRDELLNILLAARDTTSALLTFLFYFLSLHPEAAKTLRAEVMEAVPSGSPSYDDIRRLKYLRACLNETLRLFPPVPANERASTRPSLLPSPINSQSSKPIYMPGPNVAFGYSDLLMHRRTDLWGADAHEFVPERWIDPARVKSLVSDPFKFIPFNAGPRICLGQNFAYNEASFLVVRILQEFDTFNLTQEQDAPPGSLPPASWKNEPKGQSRRPIEKVWPRSDITIFSKGGMWIRMNVANPQA